MYTLLLVDDEPLELETLKDYIPWDSISIGKIFTAANGKQALECCRSTNIDIVITDIKMPVMDGIEFARQLCQAGSKTKIIFLSGYDDFDCVQGAYKAGGTDYILKPFVKNDILSVVCAAQEQLENDRGVGDAQYAYLEGLLSHVIFGGDTAISVQALRKTNIFAGVDGVYLLNIDTNATHIQFKEALRPLSRYCYAAHNQSCTALVLPAVNRMDNIISRLRDSLMAHDGAWCRFIYSREKTPLDLLNHRWTRSESYKPYFFYLSNTDCIAIDAFEQYDFDRQTPPVLARILGCDIGRLGQLRELVEQYLSGACSSHLLPAMVTEHAIDIALHIYGQYQAGTKELSKQQVINRILSVRDIEAMREMLFHLLDGLERQNAPSSDDKNDRLVAGILQRINRDYADDLTADSLANEVYLSPNYLRALFKEKTGVTIHDCITKRRMEKAAELLEMQQYKVKEISRMVGYASESYFCAIFFKFYHTTPNDYKNRHGL